MVDTRRLDLTAAHPLGRVHRVDSALTRCLHRAVMGEMLMGNINDGYLEGLLRGYRSGILTSTDYANLCQCETIDGAAAPSAQSLRHEPQTARWMADPCEAHAALSTRHARELACHEDAPAQP